MVKITKKFLSIVLIIFLCSCICCITPVFAGSPFNNGKNWVTGNGSSSINMPALYVIFEFIYNWALGIAIVLMLLQSLYTGMRIILGISTGGVIIQKVEAKGVMLRYLGYALLIAFGGSVLKWVFEFIMNIFY